MLKIFKNLSAYILLMKNRQQRDSTHKTQAPTLKQG